MNKNNNIENKIWQIKKSVLESIQVGSINTFPNEFIALLGGLREKKIIKELIFLPSEFGRNFSSIRIDLMPFDNSVVGSVHSHPSSFIKPSRADLNFFRKIGFVHIIMGYPFNLHSFNLYNVEGKVLEFKIIET